MRSELTHHEWMAIKPMLPDKPRAVRRVNDRYLSKPVVARGQYPIDHCLF
jgi:transposase